MKRKNYGIFLSAVCLGALLTACGDGAAPTESSAAEMTEETVGAVTETADVSETTTETTSESLETTTVETTAAKTTTAETTTAETTTAAPETTVETTTAPETTVPAISTIPLPDDWDSRYDLYANDSKAHEKALSEIEYRLYYNEYGYPRGIGDGWGCYGEIYEPVIFHVIENAVHITLSLFCNGNDQIEGSYDGVIPVSVDNGEGVTVYSTGVGFEEFLSYACSAFTKERVEEMMNKDSRENYISFTPYICNIDGELYNSAVSRKIDPDFIESGYSIYKITDDKVTVLRRTWHSKLDSTEGYFTYCYIDLVKTPNGWRFDYFPMLDEYYYDINENGEWLYPEYHE